MTVTERFLNYVAIDTQSDPNSPRTPSTQKQFDLARLLEKELRELGFEHVRLTDTCYLYADLPAAPGCEEAPAIGFIAHMDTEISASGANVKPQIIRDYDGGDVALGTSGRVLSPKRFPHLKNLIGRTLITTDGTTLLGADDKAGIAEILAACEKVLAEGIPHGKICVGFTPDEETGCGADGFDVAGFGARWAYTQDGERETEVNFENFNAACAEIVLHGVSVHPGDAKNTMVNAALLACRLNSMLPAAETPRHTSGYQGFYHLEEITGDVNTARLFYILRDHDASRLEFRKDTLRGACRTLNEEWGEGTAELTITDQYRNMAGLMADCPQLVDMACKAVRAMGAEPVKAPIRGGTDGATLTFMGLPCPNLSTGGFAAHGPYEHITVEGLEQCSGYVVELIRGFAGWRD